MADIYTGILTYTEFLTLTSKATSEIPEASLAIMAIPITVNSRLACLGVTDITTLTPEQKELLSLWISLFILSKVGITASGGSVAAGTLKAIDDGFVREEFFEAKDGVTSNVTGIDLELERIWHLLDMSINPKDPNASKPQGILVVNRDSRNLCNTINRITQNTRP